MCNGFKRLFHIGVWTVAWFVRPLLAAILCVWENWSGSNNPVYIYHVIYWFVKNKIPPPPPPQKKKKKKKKKTCHRTDIEADLCPETGDFLLLPNNFFTQSILRSKLRMLFSHFSHDLDSGIELKLVTCFNPNPLQTRPCWMYSTIQQHRSVQAAQCNKTQQLEQWIYCSQIALSMVMVDVNIFILLQKRVISILIEAVLPILCILYNPFHSGIIPCAWIYLFM